MKHINAHYIKHYDNTKLIELIEPVLGKTLNDEEISILTKGMAGLKIRAKTLVELAENAKFYITDQPIHMSEEAQAIISEFDQDICKALLVILKNTEIWDEEQIKAIVKEFAQQHNIELGHIAKLLRALLTGSTVSPSVFEIMFALGKEKSIERLGFFG